jgi:hypothetical protein
VKVIAMAGCVSQSRPLAGAQSLPSIGDRVIGIESLCMGVQQMDASGVGIPMIGIGQEIAIG